MQPEKYALAGTDFHFPGQDQVYRGKVRDVYQLGDLLVMVATDRISAFDHILPRPIPFKGRVLNQLAAHFLEATRDIVPNWLLATPDPQVAIGRACTPLRIEMVIRGYLSGHAWRVYRAGGRNLCGERLPEGLRESDPFPQPIITPATKAESGHDEDISAVELVRQGLATAEQYAQLEHYTRALFARGTAMAAARGLVLVDTKYEFGLYQGEIYLIDEIHTPDSSRYFYQDGYAERQARGEHQPQLSKEFVREWLMEQGFQGLEGQVMPAMPDDFVWTVSTRYQELYERLIGQPLDQSAALEPATRIDQRVREWLANAGRG